LIKNQIIAEKFAFLDLFAILSQYKQVAARVPQDGDCQVLD
jgi:hypothetical protein